MKIFSKSPIRSAQTKTKLLCLLKITGSAKEWIQKLWYIYTMEFYAAERKKELIPFATAWMKLESIMLSEVSQVVREKYHMISPLTGTKSTKEKSKKIQPETLRLGTV